MIDKAILDEVLPVPELETLKEEKIAELRRLRNHELPFGRRLLYAALDSPPH